MKTLKSIKTKRMMTMVANAVEKSLNEGLGYYSSIEIKKETYNSSCVFKIAQKNYTFMLPAYVMDALKAIDHYKETYRGVFAVIETTPFYVEEINGFLHRPVIEVQITMNK